MVVFDPGSSPRVRGKRELERKGGTPTRLIPACAGKTRCPRGFIRLPMAHPRVCGENFTSLKTLPRSLGSSPRVRGKRYSPTVKPEPEGLIPACAGKT